MKTAYFDCSSGISGNMALGALVDAGVPIEYLKNELKKLNLKGYRIILSQKKSGIISATYIEVECHEHCHRKLSDIEKTIKKSRLTQKIKNKSLAVFRKLAFVESIVHRQPINKLHFHEVGSLDAIIDIVGTIICLDHLKIGEIYCSPINVGSGKVKCTHGTFPVPAPATAELLKGIPIYSSSIKKELTTPTGAAIITILAKSFGPLPRIKYEKTGYGAGGYPLKIQPNFLRVMIGEKELETEKDAVLMIKTNIDDMDPKLWDKAIAAIGKAGAYDAYIEPIRMKKGRLAFKLSILSPIELKDKVLEAIFRETTSFGVRVFLMQREKLDRSFKKIKTKYGRIKIKVGKLGKEITTFAPEYEDYKKISEKHRIPIEVPYKEALKIFKKIRS